MNKKINTIIYIGLISILSLNAQNKEYKAPNGMVYGGQFTDLFLPVELNGLLRSDVWGADCVLPRDVNNGIEDEIYSYWGGNIIKSEDGKFHMFPCRWEHNKKIGNKSGHMLWSSSEVVHAVSDNPTGPYKVLEVIGPGHNPEVYKSKKGGYVLGVMGSNAYTSASLNGPWTKITPKFQWLVCSQSTENRTYATRPDGAALMMNKSGNLFISENADEDFIQLTDFNAMKSSFKGDCKEDPVIWRDEVQYHCVYNDCYNRVAFYMRSKDGINWIPMEGVAYRPDIMNHVGGTSENWFKFERVKVLQDKYGRATHMNFAVLDTLKWEDLANDKYGSKNIVLPLKVHRRINILNKNRINESTNEIEIKILAEDGFNPSKEVDVKTLKFGAPETVNFGGGAKAIDSKKDGKNLIVTFKGNETGFTSENFAAKLIGKDNSGELVLGSAKMKPAPELMEDKIVSQTVLDEISVSGKMKFAVFYKTKEKRNLRVELINLSTNKTVKSNCSKVVDGEDVTVVHFETSSSNSLNLTDKYQLKTYLTTLDSNPKTVSKVKTKNLIVVPLNAPEDKINSVNGAAIIPQKGKVTWNIAYQAKGDREVRVDMVRKKPYGDFKSFDQQVVKAGIGTIQIDLEFKKEEALVLDEEFVLFIYLVKKGGGKKDRISSKLRKIVRVEN